MLMPQARPTCCLLIALLAVGCVEVDVRRTVDADGSGRQSITVRTATDAALPPDAFPGLIAGASCAPPTRRIEGDRAVHAAEIAFKDVARFRHQVKFLTSSASVKPGADGTAAYREVLTNTYFRSLERAPSPEASKSIAAAMADAKKSLAAARVTYTVTFPGAVVGSNADRVSGREATWVLTAAKAFAGRTMELAASYRTKPAPAVAAAPAPPAPAAPAPPKPAPAAAPARVAPHRVELPTLAAPSRLRRPVAPALAPPAVRAQQPLAAPTTDAAPIQLAQATDAPAAAAAPAPAAADAPRPAATLDEAAADDPKTKQVKKLFRDALVHIDYKRYDKAAETLQQAIALKPNTVFIFDLYEQVIAKFLDKALESQNADLKARAEDLQKIAYEGRLRRLRDPDRIKELVAGLRKGFLPRTFAIEELTLAGDYAVPHLLKTLQEHTNAEDRAFAGYVLSRLRGTAVPAICEALKYKDPLVRQIIIQALETIADPRATPALLWLAQETDGHPLVVAAAKQALAKTATDPTVAAMPAPVAYLELARAYYNRDKRVLLPHVYEHLVWRYDPDKNELVSESVPRHLYPLRMAEEMCRNAILVNPAYDPATPLLICAYFAQQNLLEGFFSTIEGKDKLTPEEEQEAKLATPIRERLQMAPAVAQATGKKFVYAALQLALRDARADVAISCIHVLSDIADGSALPGPPPTEEEVEKMKREERRRKRGSLFTWYGPKRDEEPEPPPPTANPYALSLDGTPLIDALSYPDRRVRYAAAEAIVAIAPTQVIRDASKVMANLSQALGETAYHVALVVDEDAAAAEELRPLLREAGVMPVLARSQRDAITAANQLPPKDLIILSAELKKVGVAEMLANLRGVYTLAATPVVIVTTKSDVPKLRLLFQKEKVAFITRPYVAATVRRELAALLQDAPEPKAKELAAAYASAAARTIASVDPATSLFRVKDTLDALLAQAAATTQPDEVRIPCCAALQHIADARAIPNLARIYNDAKSSKELRLAALRALGACAAAGPDVPQDLRPLVAGVLTVASREPDIEFRRAAAHAFGLSGGAAGNIVEVIDHLHGRDPVVREAPAEEKPAEGAPAPAVKAE